MSQDVFVVGVGMTPFRKPTTVLDLDHRAPRECRA